jgi:hypothetical protein
MVLSSVNSLASLWVANDRFILVVLPISQSVPSAQRQPRNPKTRFPNYALGFGAPSITRAGRR